MKYFGTVRQQLRRKIVILPPLIKTFSIPEINETLKDSTPYGIFRHCETKNFERKVVHKIQKSVVELMFVENFRKLDFKQ